jgi:hypothetical protein
MLVNFATVSSPDLKLLALGFLSVAQKRHEAEARFLRGLFRNLKAIACLTLRPATLKRHGLHFAQYVFAAYLFSK